MDVTWNWDQTGWTGANTGDACSLFDTDGDAQANYALCVTVENTPAVYQSTTLYSCGDTSPFKCATPNPSIPSFSSTCSASVTATQPFGTGDDTPNDAVATCTVVMSDFGVQDATLLNTCSYPSAQPNSDYSDCVLVPRTAYLVIDKIANPDNQSDTFDFYADGGVSPVFTANGSETSNVIAFKPDQTHTISETVPNALWSLTSVSCGGPSGTVGTPDLAGKSIGDVLIGADQTVTCTFNNAFDEATPSISTQASSSGVVGDTISDTATLSGGYNPTGTITFNLYGPGDATCQSPIYTTQQTVTGNGAYVTPAYTTTAAGTYRWIASYSGDANNNPVSGACNDAGESVVVDK